MRAVFSCKEKQEKLLSFLVLRLLSFLRKFYSAIRCGPTVRFATDVHSPSQFFSPEMGAKILPEMLCVLTMGLVPGN
jgi:hypothetical protein